MIEIKNDFGDIIFRDTTVERFATEVLAAFSGITVSAIENGHLTPEQFEKVHLASLILKDLGIWIRDYNDDVFRPAFRKFVQ